MPAEHFHVDGIVQGVGFRPFVYRLARRYGLRGWVRNHTRGVDIAVAGPQAALDAFALALQAEAPPLAQIRQITRSLIPESSLDGDFRILHSEAEEGFTLVSPDVATCPDCLRELFDPSDRRYRYPFINCTNCGPRFSIIRALPYDRPQTTMAAFTMCPACQAEYDDPLNRRFHAQPNACPTCGPHLWFETADRRLTVRGSDKALTTAARWLREGRIVAVKGLGGFHLACDATDTQAVQRLRERKTRPHKPLALMMHDLEMVRGYCRLTPDEEALLTSPSAPIVLLEPLPGNDLSPLVAPGQRRVGVMLPYTPLHHLLLHEVQRPLVMTSGNRRDEPIARTNEEARANLAGLADAFLWHNRPIYNRVDDSVWAVTALGPMPIRRSRGYAPQPIEVPVEAPTPVLATGGEMKNTFCLLARDLAFLSQHIGELELAETWAFFTESVARYQELFGITPGLIAHDMHPDFTVTALEALQDLAPGARPVPVQHHHAHIAACLAENGVTGPAIGVALDGTGYGPDGTIWGGEILVASLRRYHRVGRWQVFPLPGGEAAIRQPLRIALGLLGLLYSEPPTLPLLEGVAPLLRHTLSRQVQRKINTPLTSSCGRLFDAVAALLGVRESITYEGQAAIELETLAATAWPAAPFPITIHRNEGLWEFPSLAVFRAAVEAIQQGAPPARIAARFHATVIAGLRQMVHAVREETGIHAVALSGGCFQNRLLLEGLAQTLQADGFTVYTHHQVPPNDGGLSLGQAVIAASISNSNEGR